MTLDQFAASTGMTADQFAALCGKYAIDPGIALEDEKLQVALKANNDAEVERILREEF